MDARKPAAYGYTPCPHRGVRPAQMPQTRAPMQAPAAPRASAAALSQLQQQPAAPTPPPVQAQPLPAPAPTPPPPPPPPAQLRRVYLSAYAKDFNVTAESGRREPLPLEAQRAEGGMSIAGGSADVPEDGYYMVLWELGVTGADGEATLQLGINDAASQLTYALRPGYDSGQQVTWLGKGDKLGLFAQAEDEKAEVYCGSAQLTVIRLG